ncbi:hypothetical protein GALMADRAFT_148558 [Galerina marginata CBS 339.88]|uniref:Uncharacterized protein n=1 Tax=Galerina marginata (strain CBS 339.88) TaxID=685588 RepID=A0A067S447_GALM3|nr:hypothetical protein GALMADRAFT_148558 [Galerina marginata CBS 339.88]
MFLHPHHTLTKPPAPTSNDSSPSTHPHPHWHPSSDVERPPTSPPPSPPRGRSFAPRSTGSAGRPYDRRSDVRSPSARSRPAGMPAPPHHDRHWVAAATSRHLKDWGRIVRSRDRAQTASRLTTASLRAALASSRIWLPDARVRHRHTAGSTRLTIRTAMSLTSNEVQPVCASTPISIPPITFLEIVQLNDCLRCIC